MTEEYQLGTTVILQASYFDLSDNALDADSAPIIEIRDARNRIVQTNLISTKTATGVYQYKFKTTGLVAGKYFHTWRASFSTYPNVKSGDFVLNDIAI